MGTARQLLNILEHGVAQTAPGETPGRFPQVGGMTFSYDATRAAAEDSDGDGILDPGEDKNSNGVLDAGQRIRSVAIVNDDNRITDIVVQNGAIVGNADRTFRMVTLNFLADGGDAYPIKRFADANPTLANRVDLTKTGVRDGSYTQANTGSEQDALAEYLLKIGTFNQEDTGKDQDTRIQDVSARGDSVLSGARQFTGSGRRDVLLGGSGDDLLTGGGGRDVLRGFAGDDVLDGGKGNDRLDAAQGRDLIRSGAGNDTVICGQGRDVVVLETGKGRDFIRDFAGADKLGLNEGLRFGSLEIRQVGRNTFIRQENDLLAILRNVDADTINRRDFTTNF